jgi:DNA-directed RNA polymerase alpha subunit
VRQRAKMLERDAAPSSPDDAQLHEADFSEQIVGLLKKMGVKKLADLARLSKGDLWAQSQLGKTDVLRILRVCREHGVTLRDG